ncbi:MAG TPA: hypothetical protein PLO24_03505 [Bacteroidales bacterium]|jgi:hypothetical protein|nr:hypothetical protein [Bacteroidales bacterium]HOS71408.1 hypothetical protein [Bacteroidales bacterium]HQH23713.1 hypothetical protein [Bacteroidales bacterium]HQJ82282.1 hypothetical protein [Bacteroidales bacterium]
MKKSIYFAGIIILFISGISCSDDFLSKNEKNLYELNDTLKLDNRQTNVQVPVQLPVLTDGSYTLFMQPKWLSFNVMKGKVTKGKFILDFDILNDYYKNVYEIFYATVIIDIENLGLVGFTVSYENSGFPVLEFTPSVLRFDSFNYQTLTIRNTSEGLLKWKITDIPEWLYLYPEAGSLQKDQSTMVMIHILPDPLKIYGQTSAELQLVSNSTNGNLILPVQIDESLVVQKDLVEIAGTVTDAEFSQESGIMAVITKSPDNLIIYNTSTKESRILSLPHSPKCISISEEGDKAVIGYNTNLAGYWDLDNSELLRDYTIDCTPFDIVFGENGWCYISPDEGGFTGLRNLNLATGELSVTGSSSVLIYEKTTIAKMQGKPFIVGTRILTPSGILIFDISGGRANDKITYYHTCADQFWIKKDGTRLYTYHRLVYYLPPYDGEYHPFDPPVFAHIESSSPYITSFGESPGSGTIYTASTFYDNDPQYNAVIEQYYSGNLRKIRTFYVSPVFINENGTKELYKTSVRYLFADKYGSYVYAVKNLREYYHRDYWTIETVDVR